VELGRAADSSSVAGASPPLFDRTGFPQWSRSRPVGKLAAGEPLDIGGALQRAGRVLMGSLKSYPEPAWLRASVQAELEPGEAIEAMADFSLPVTNQQTVRLFVLTNRHLRCLAFKVTIGGLFGGGKARPVTWSYALRFDQITSFGEQRQGGLLIAEMRGLVFTGPTGMETWWTKYSEGAALIESLRQRLAQPSSAPAGLADELGRLSALRAEGVLSDDEFDRAKTLFLGRPADERAQVIGHLKQLHALCQSGVLTPGEFNQKKWDVLVRT
jgi:hypothetical protein